MRLHHDEIAQFYRDPVMAAYVLMGWDIDAYQAAGLRFDWWFPRTVDNSGVSTGKTLRIFLLACLRAMLIPDQWVGVYFPVWGTGKQEFWPYFKKTIEQKPEFLDHFTTYRKNELGEHLDADVWWVELKNGSRISMPAPGFITDSRSQASRRFNTLIVDDWFRAVDMGEGVDKQLAQRVSRPSYNKHHPIWANHFHLKGHAEKPSHKGQRRVRGYRKRMRDGSREHHIYSFCYRDISKKFAPVILDQAMIDDARSSLTRDEFMRQVGGISVAEGRTYYPEGRLVRVTLLFPSYRPLLKREREDEIFACGFDTAAGQSIRADLSASCVWRARPAEGEQWPATRFIEDAEGRSKGWHVSPVYAHEMMNLSAPDMAGYLHELDEAFGFDVLVLDPGGGGLFVLKDLREPKQRFRGREWDVIPWTTPDDVLVADKRAVVHPFRRKGKLGELCLTFAEPGVMVSDDGFLAAWHKHYRESWESPTFAWSRRVEDRSEEELRLYNGDERHILAMLDKTLKQTTRIRKKLDKQGNIETSGKGFEMFVATGKKDSAMAGFYGHAGIELALWKKHEEGDEDGGSVSLW